MAEREARNTRSVQSEMKILLVLLAGAMGACSFLASRSFQENPESTTASELTGTGYRITRSDLGHNLARIEGLNRFPAATPYDGIKKGRERIRIACGPILKEEEVISQGEVPKAFLYIEVPDIESCFRK